MLNFRHIAGLVLFLLTFYYVSDYPYAKIFLGALLSAYTAFSLIKPAIWLLVLPAALPLLSLAPWSGRFFLEEFDFFIWITISTALWRGDFSLKQQPRFAIKPILLIGCLFIAHGIALTRGLMPYSAIDANSFNNYYSPYYALRVGKAFFWALLLILPLRHAFTSNREQARELLSLGICIGLLGTGAAILWERGVVWDLLYGKGISGRLQGLTNFSAEYRATGLLADMHTGGEAIDGYLAMAWPFALGLLIHHLGNKSVAIGVLALPVGLYSALVTFSRGTYMAVVVSLLVFGLGYGKKLAYAAPSKGSSNWIILAVLLAAMATCAFLYGKGGWYALLAALAILSGTIVLVFIRANRLELRVLSLGLVFLSGCLLMMRGLLTSKWVSNDWGTSILVTVLVSVSMLLAGLFIGKRTRQFMSFRSLIISLCITTSIIAVCTPIATGTYIKSRFSTTEGDFIGRMGHWKHAIDLMDLGWDTTVFGMGLGAFPRAYSWSSRFGGKESSSVVQLQNEPFNTYLKLSSTMDLTLGQRISLEANQDYTLSIDARTQVKQGMLGISICRRNILYPTLWNPTCIYYEKSVAKSDKKWQTLTWNFNIGDKGNGYKMGRHPLVLRVSNGLPHNEVKSFEDRSIDCDNIRLLNRQGEDLLSNGDFEAQLDRWYLYTDFYHLPLHIKNLWVTAYFEQGLFGLISFAALILYTLITGIRLAGRGDSFAITILASLLGFLSVGLIGTLLDVPRVSFLFFFLQFALLAQAPAPNSKHSKSAGHSVRNVSA